MAISCDPNSLLTQAKCFPCVPRGSADGVKTYLLCQWANKGGSTPTVPNAPTATAATQNYGYSLTATWTAPGAGPVPTGYKLSWNGGAYVDVGNVFSFNETGLTPNTAYHYTVKAYNGVGDSVPSNQINVTAFRPDQLGLSVWYDAKALAALPDGTPLPVWVDTSGNVNNANYSGGPPDQPTYAAASSPFGGASFPSVFFPIVTTGSGLIAANPGPSLVAGMSVFSVCHPQNNFLGTPQAIIGSRSRTLFYVDFALGPPAYIDWFNNNLDTTSVVTVGDGSNSLVELVDDGVTVPTMYHNGTIVANDGINFDTNHEGMQLAPIVVADFDDAGQFTFSGYIAEIIVVPFNVSSSVRVQIEQYLNIKWNLGF